MRRTPMHLWIIAVLSLLWNARGAFDYLMIQLQVDSYMALLTEPQQAYLEMRPMWFDATWAIGVWFAVLGSLLLLLRSAWATASFTLALVGLIASSVWSNWLATPTAPEVMSGFNIWFTLLVAGILLFLVVYSRIMASEDVLR
jgi:hypothetical protein